MFSRWPAIAQFEFLLWGAAAIYMGLQTLEAARSGQPASIQLWLRVSVSLALFAYALFTTYLFVRWTLWYRLRRVAFADYNSGNYERAARLYQRAAQLEPRRGESHYDLGISLLEAGDHQEAVTSLSRAIELDPLSSNYLRARSQAYYDLGEAGLSQADAEAAAALETPH